MGDVKVKIEQPINLEQYFKFGFKVGSLGKQPRFKATSKPTTYADGAAKAKSNEQSNITNNDVIGYLLDKKINVLATPFRSKDPRLGKVGWYFYNIATDYDKSLYINKSEKLLSDVIKEFMRKGEFGKNKKGLRMTINTGQLHSSIKSIYVENMSNTETN